MTKLTRSISVRATVKRPCIFCDELVEQEDGIFTVSHKEDYGKIGIAHKYCKEKDILERSKINV